MLTGAFCVLLGHAAEAGDEHPSCRDDAIIVFDASGSMREPTESGMSRIDIARAAAHQVIPLAAKSRNLGLIIYGPGQQARCRKLTLEVEPQPDAADKILAAIDNTKTEGETPLTSAVDAAAQALDFTRKRGVVVLLTDGDENCGRYPCALAHELQEKGQRLVVHVIAFRLQPRSFRALHCLSRETGGLLLPANTMEDLVNALSQTLTCPEVTEAPGAFKGSIERSTFPSAPDRLFAGRLASRRDQCLPP